MMAALLITAASAAPVMPRAVTSVVETTRPSSSPAEL